MLAAAADFHHPLMRFAVADHRLTLPNAVDSCFSAPPSIIDIGNNSTPPDRGVSGPEHRPSGPHSTTQCLGHWQNPASVTTNVYCCIVRSSYIRHFAILPRCSRTTERYHWYSTTTTDRRSRDYRTLWNRTELRFIGDI